MKISRPYNDPNILYHYCSMETAIEKILPKMDLRISPIINTKDPRENRELLFQYGTNRSVQKTPDINELIKLDSLFTKKVREDCKVLCFSRDYRDYRGYALSKMWAHYGGNHKGVCLAINKRKFESENIKKIDEKLFKEVIYTSYRVKGRKVRMNVPLDRIEFGEKDVVSELKQRHLDHLFFTKNDEWETESEFRLICFSKESEDYCSIRESLESIYLGIDFHDGYCPSIKAVSNEKKIFRMRFVQDGLAAVDF